VRDVINELPRWVEYFVITYQNHMIMM